MLLDLTRRAPPELVVETMRTFGQRAAWIVGVLLVAGAALLIVLCVGELRPDSTYQQRFIIKLAPLRRFCRLPPGTSYV